MQTVFEAIGTHWALECVNDESKISDKDLLVHIHSAIEAFDKIFSRFRKDSLVWKISEQSGKFTFPEYSDDLFSIYDTLYDLTQGAFTPLIGNALVQAGYDDSYSLVPKIVEPLTRLHEVYSYTHPILTVHTPAMLDFGAAGKGYLVDIIGQVMETYKIQHYCINAGGDIRFRGKQPLRVGLENPFNTTEVIGISTIEQQSICGSAGSRRTWDRYHHILDPKTLESPKHIAATWVVAPTTMVADAVSTALFLVDPEKIIEVFPVEYGILFSDSTFKLSKHFPGEMFIQ